MRYLRCLPLLLCSLACSVTKQGDAADPNAANPGQDPATQGNDTNPLTPEVVPSVVGGNLNNSFGTGPSLAPDSAYIRYLGRVEPGAPGGVRLAWSGAGFKVRITGGTQLVVSAMPNQYGENNVMGAYIDDAFQGTYKVQGADPTSPNVRFVVPVPTGDHVVTLIKRTEAGNGMVLIAQLQTDGQFEELAASTRSIEIVGDNVVAGYSAAGTAGVTTCAQPINSVADPDQQDAGATFGALAARSFGATYSLLGTSGRGLVRNFDGSTGINILDMYPRRNPMDVTSAIPSGVNANAVVINVGSNDINYWMKNQNNVVADPNGFTAAYVALIKKVRALNPDAAIFATVGPVLGNTQCVGSTAANYACSGGGTGALTLWRTMVQAAVSQAADSKTTFLEFPATISSGNNISACYLPSAAGHVAMSQVLIPALASATGWAAGSSGTPANPAAGTGASKQPARILTGKFVPRPDVLSGNDPNNGVTNKEFPQCHYCSPTAYNANAVTGACGTLMGTNYACQSYCHVPDGFAELQATDPPTSGNHYATPALVGLYSTPQPRGRLIHSMEHGTILLTYNCPSGCDAEVARMRTLYQAYLTTDPTKSAAWVIVAPDPELQAGKFGIASWTWAMALDTFDAAAQATADCFIKQHAFYGRECPNDGSSANPRACPSLFDRPMTSVGG